MTDFVPEDYNFENDYFTLNVDKFPYIYITLKDKSPTDEEFDEYRKYVEKLLLEPRYCGIMFNLSKTGYLKTKYRVQVANWFKENREHVSKYCRGTAHITDSAVHKFLFKAIFAMQPPPYEYIVVKEENKGYEWLKEQLKANL